MRGNIRNLSSSNKLILCIMSIFTIASGVVYFFVTPQQMNFDAVTLVQCSVLGMICIIGFSLIQFYKNRQGETVLPQTLLTVAIGLIVYFPVSCIFARANPYGKSIDNVSVGIALSPNSNDLGSKEFNMGLTVVDMFRFCLVAIISQSGRNVSGLLPCLLMIFVQCPFYVLTNLILLYLRYTDSGSTIQLFVFASTYGFFMEWCLRYQGSPFAPDIAGNKRRPSNISKILLLFGAIICWALIPFIVQTREISTDLNIKQRLFNPMALVQQQNTFTALFSCVLGILLQEASNEATNIKIETMAYSLICSTIMLCTAGEYIRAPAVATCLAVASGYLFNQLFKKSLSEEVSRADLVGDWKMKLSETARRTFVSNCVSVLGFGIAGGIGSLLTVIFGLLSLADWLNPYFGFASSLSNARALAYYPVIVLVAFIITVVLAGAAGVAFGWLLHRISNRQPALVQERIYSQHDDEQDKIFAEQSTEHSYEML